MQWKTTSHKSLKTFDKKRTLKISSLLKHVGDSWRVYKIKFDVAQDYKASWSDRETRWVIMIWIDSRTRKKSREIKIMIMNSLKPIFIFKNWNECVIINVLTRRVLFCASYQRCYFISYRLSSFGFDNYVVVVTWEWNNMCMTNDHL